MAKHRPPVKPTITDAELEVGARMHRNEGLIRLARDVVKWGTFGFIAWCAMKSIGSLAGKTTDANIVLKLIANIAFSSKVSWVVGGAGYLYGRRERKLRHQANEVLGTRVAELEAQIDPDRTSSHLTRQGQTHPRDRI